MKRLLTTILPVFLGVAALAAAAETDVERPWDGNKTTPVHRFNLMDENGEAILPAQPETAPLSVKQTCGSCHDYDTIAKGRHFNYLDPSVKPGRMNQPWVLVDEKTGTQLPLSYRKWDLANVWRPDQIGMTLWEFTKAFGRHLPGGGATEPATPETGNMRWVVSGGAEINCFACHNRSPRQDMSEWAKQMARENYRWAATGASGLGDVNGMASRQKPEWDKDQGPALDDRKFAIPPSVTYDATQFDSKGRAWLNVGKPDDQRCLYCHSVAKAGEERAHSMGDIHSAKGIGCADCHKNGLNHDISRGDEKVAAKDSTQTSATAVTAAEKEKQAESVDLSCRGCHLGDAQPKTLADRGGWHAAPRPEHKNIPVIHFDKMTCTSCHSGQLPQAQPTQVRTARANRTGIHGRAQWFTDSPYIVEPVFRKGADGKIGPYRMMWPAFWARIEGDKVTPLKPEVVQKAGTGVLDVQEQVAAQLTALGSGLAELAAADPAQGGEAVLLTPGEAGKSAKLFRVDAEGRLDMSDAKTTLTVTTMAWARDLNGKIRPLLTAFNEMGDAERTAILAMLKALDPKDAAKPQPVLRYKGKQYGLEVLPALSPDDQTSGAALKAEHQAQFEAWEKDPKAVEKAIYEVEGEFSENGVKVKKALIFRWDFAQGLAVKDVAEAKGDEMAWGWLSPDGKFAPLVSELVAHTAPAVTDQEKPLTEDQVAAMLQALAGQEKGEYGFVAQGKLFRVGQDGKLAASDHKAAEAVAWPLAHDVRPASQALGAATCTDCHAKDAPFYFGEVTATGPLQTKLGATAKMKDLMQADPTKIEQKEYSVVMKAFFWLIVVTMTLLIAHIIVDAIRRIEKKFPA
jgi:nitrate/TMAO reductase-like tetraheme cytochrome c subunit